MKPSYLFLRVSRKERLEREKNCAKNRIRLAKRFLIKWRHFAGNANIFLNGNELFIALIQTLSTNWKDANSLIYGCCGGLTLLVNSNIPFVTHMHKWITEGILCQIQEMNLIHSDA